VTVWQQISIVALRFAVGWHLFLEGYGKLVASQWWAEAPLSSASGPLAPVLRRMSESPWLFVAAERTTSYGLMVLGVLLMVGLLTRIASFLAIALLAAYLLAHPPLPVSGFLLPNAEGTGMYVNSTLIELLGLVASFAFDSGRIAGLDVVLLRRRREKAEKSFAVEDEGTNWSVGPRP
jgi:thiosulfate dehydrogenase [quinone] large subunit